jgi:glycolate oxidase FAD binding subunit
MATHDPALARLIEQVEQALQSRSPLEIRGGGTKLFYGGAAVGRLLDLRDLRGISSYEPSELVVTARAGTPLTELETALAEKGQCLPFEPPRFAPGGTVGGMVAAGLSGPPRASVGSVRDHVLGLTLLNGRGELLSFGGQVAKNVAGYDVSRLMAGSMGILGVICEVSIKVLPFSVATATLSFECDAASAVQRHNSWASQPLPINAMAWCDGQLNVRLSGAAAAVAAACDKLGGETMPAGAAGAWWTGVRDHAHEFFALNAAALGAGEALWRLSVPTTAAPLTLPGRQFIEWNGAQRWWRTSASASQMRTAAGGCGGHAVLHRGTDKSAGAFSPLHETLMGIHRGLKQAFDPSNIFNPGRLYAGL